MLPSRSSGHCPQARHLVRIVHEAIYLVAKFFDIAGEEWRPFQPSTPRRGWLAFRFNRCKTSGVARIAGVIDGLVAGHPPPGPVPVETARSCDGSTLGTL